MKVSEVLALYLDDRLNVIDPIRLMSAVKRLNEVFADNHIRDVDIPACRKYYEHRKKTKRSLHGDMKPISDATIAKELGVLRSAANNALKWRKITANDMPSIEVPKNLPARVVWFHKDEVKKLFEASAHDKYLSAYVLMMYATGSRRRAIEELEWSQVDFDNNVIMLNKPGQQQKNKKRPTVPMGSLSEVLRPLHEERVNKYVLGSSMNRYHQFRKLLLDTNLLLLPERDGRPQGRACPHIMRHSRATHLLQRGMTPYAVGRLLGDNPLTIIKTYGHACMSELEGDLEKYGGI